MDIGNEARPLEQAHRHRQATVSFHWILQQAVHLAYHKPLGAAGCGIIVLFVLVAILAPVVSPYDPLELHDDHRFEPPGAQFLLGTDNFGRDIFSRVLYGTRIALYVSVTSVVLGQLAGTAIGLLSGYIGGKVDALVQRVVDVLMSFPVIILALAIMTALGPSVNNVILTLTIVQAPRSSRLLRSVALSIKETQYIEAALAMGCSHGRVIVSHLFPQCIAPLIVVATAEMAQAVLLEASLSFLGAGAPPPTPSWGAMLSGAGRSYLLQTPWLAVFPGLAITVVVFGVNMFGDALRDILDPRLRGA